MKKPSFVLVLVAAFVVPGQLAAMVTTYGKEAVHSSSWVKGLDAIVNHPSRVSGMIGPFGPSGRFQFAGTVATFNDVLKVYAQVSQPARILYLTSASQSTGSAQVPNYELSINHDGQGYLHLNVEAATDLVTLRVPPGVTVESLPASSVPIGLDRQEREAAAQRAIEQFLQRREANAEDALQTGELKVGSMAPVVSGLSADGNAIDAANPWPAHFTNKTVLVVFWSLKDSASAGLIDRLNEIRKEFGANPNFQMVSFCVDTEWAPWMRWVSRRVDYGQGELRLSDDPKWWQVIQDPNAPAAAGRFGIDSLPAAFLVGADRRIAASKIAPGKMREAVAGALEH